MPAMLETQVLRTIRKHEMLQPGEQILVAASGGADSTALLFCLHRLAPRMGWRLTVAHFNHGIRGAEADRDEEFVGQMARRLGLPFVSERARLAGPPGSRRANLEERARASRYAFLKRAAAAAGATKIAVGHSLNDQAETVLSRLLRGSGLEGLSAILPVADGTIVRPLLECSRSRILAYLQALGIEFRDDSTNADLRFQRNRIRHELIPRLERDFNRRAVEILAREAGLAREAAEYLRAHTREIYESLRAPVPGGVSLPADRVAALPPVIRKWIVRHALADCRGSLRGISLQHILDILALCRPRCSGRRIHLPGAATAVREFERLVLVRSGPAGISQFCYELPLPGQCRVPEAGMVFRATLSDGYPVDPPADPSCRVILNAGLLPSTLQVRSRLPGDRYGGPGHRKVKRLLNVARIPVTGRPRLPMVAAGEAIVWIPGLQPAKSFIAGPGAGRCVVLEVNGP